MDLYIYKLLRFGFDTETYGQLISNASNYVVGKINEIDSYISKCNQLFSDLLLKNCCNNLYHYWYDKNHITLNTYGKPSFKNNKIFFNISHSREYGALAVSCCPIGIDIEDKIDNFDTRIFKLINNTSDTNNCKEICNKSFKMLKEWTAKESFLKGLGIGLTYPIKEIFFCEENKTISIDKHHREKWFVSQIYNDKFMLSISAPKIFKIHIHFVENIQKYIN